MTPASIHLQIDELILHGFSTADRHIILDAVETELAKLIEENGLPDKLEGDTEVVKSPSVTLPANTSPSRAGKLIATAIYESLEQTGARHE